ncbi:hypothetical protein E8E11_001060 [Didymella keratinophila]|nr:hypothetical protein E8E11_001060 [Didymella keratinophila]
MSSPLKVSTAPTPESKFSEIEALIPKLRVATDYLNEREQTLSEKQLLSREPDELFFDSTAEAQFDLSIPTTHAEKLALIKELVVAITDPSKCLTTNSSNAAQIEAVAWALLQLMIDIHHRGWSVAFSDPKQRDDVCLSM